MIDVTGGSIQVSRGDRLLELKATNTYFLLDHPGELKSMDDLEPFLEEMDVEVDGCEFNHCNFNTIEYFGKMQTKNLIERKQSSSKFEIEENKKKAQPWRTFFQYIKDNTLDSVTTHYGIKMTFKLAENMRDFRTMKPHYRLLATLIMLLAVAAGVVVFVVGTALAAISMLTYDLFRVAAIPFQRFFKKQHDVQ